MIDFASAETRTSMTTHECARTDMLVFVAESSTLVYAFAYSFLVGASMPAVAAIAWGLVWRLTA